MLYNIQYILLMFRLNSAVQEPRKARWISGFEPGLVCAVLTMMSSPDSRGFFLVSNHQLEYIRDNTKFRVKYSSKTFKCNKTIFQLLSILRRRECASGGF